MFTEAQYVEMEQRARWLLDGALKRQDDLEQRELEQSRPRVLAADWVRVEWEERLARDVLLLVGLIRKSGAGR